MMNGLFYTAISRVKTGDGLFLRSFNPDYIKANPEVENKMKAMSTFSPYQFKKVYLDEKIFVGDEELKLGYINIRSLLKGKSLEFIENDRNLHSLNYLVVADTGLDGSTSTEFLAEHLSNWQVKHRFDAADGHKHMGLLVLQGQSASTGITFKVEEEWKEETASKSVYVQILKIFFEEFLLHTAFIYINHTPNTEELDHMIRVLNPPGEPGSQLIIGDLNLERDRDQGKLNKLCGDNKHRILNEITTDNFNQLDHVIFVEDPVWQDAFSTSYHNYTSDHNAVVIRIPKKGNHFSSQFKQRLHHDQYKETRTGQKRKAESSSQSPPKKRPLLTTRKRKSGVMSDVVIPRKISRSIPVLETLPMISEEMMTVINEVFALPNDNSLVVSNFGLDMRRRYFDCLKDGVWLTSDIIDYMFRLISANTEATHAFLCPFIQFLTNLGHEGVARHTRGLDLFGFKKVLVPIHTPGHWTFAGIDMEQKRITYFDSMIKPATPEILQTLLNYLDAEHQARKECGLNLSEWTLTHAQGIPQQNNFDDCGLFIIKYAQYFARGSRMTFRAEDMSYYRKRMVWEIKKKILLWP